MQAGANHAQSIGDARDPLDLPDPATGEGDERARRLAKAAATVDVLSGLDVVRGVDSVVRVEDLGRTAPEVGT